MIFNMDDYLSAEQAASVLGMTPTRFKRLCREGVLPAPDIRLTQKVRFWKKDALISHVLNRD